MVALVLSLLIAFVAGWQGSKGPQTRQGRDGCLGENRDHMSHTQWDAMFTTECPYNSVDWQPLPSYVE